jgi:hypothetical protein
MACQVTITSVTASGPPLTAVHVSGTATVPDCTSVRVILECGGSPGPKLVVPVDASGNWIVARNSANKPRNATLRQSSSRIQRRT